MIMIIIRIIRIILIKVDSYYCVCIDKTSEYEVFLYSIIFKEFIIKY